MKHQITTFFFGLIGLIFCFMFWNEVYFWSIIIPFLLIYLLIVCLGSYFIHLNYHIKSISETNANGVLFSFDDGPHPQNTLKILDILDKNSIKAVFFMIGKEVEKYPEIVREVVRRGHFIGNHSYSHSNFLPFFNANKIMKDFTLSKEAIRKITGYSSLLIRVPFGATSPRYYKFIKKTPFRSIGWKVRSFDTKEINPEKFISDTVSKIEKNPDGICLFHDTQDLTVLTLPKIIDSILSKGTKIVSLSDIPNVTIYEK